HRCTTSSRVRTSHHLSYRPRLYYCRVLPAIAGTSASNTLSLHDALPIYDKSVHGVLNPTYQAGLRRDAVQPDIEAERKKRDEIEAGKSYCSRRFGGATCDDKSAQIYARFDKNDWRIQPAEF